MCEEYLKNLKNLLCNEKMFMDVEGSSWSQRLFLRVCSKFYEMIKLKETVYPMRARQPQASQAMSPE